ncbi:MAG: hypothetical protein H6Q55_1549 [Deltaproteobacteria bacterium]|nr:hypothetical protein [Deltaproteobacteria bacterium]
MATFIGLVNFTDQGIRNVKDSPDRYEAFRAMAERVGVTVKGVYYTIGRYDMVLIMEGSYDMVLIMEGSDEAAVTAMLKVGSLGNVRTETLRCFSLEEMRKIVGTLP